MQGVSLIIPCHNCEATLERAVLSGLRQPLLYELIIVDDFSSDSTWKLAQRLANNDSRIHVIQTNQNLGPGTARNLGARSAQASYISFLDADDELLGAYFEEALSVLSSHPEMHAIKPEEEFRDPIKGYILPAYDPRHAAAVLSSVHGLVMLRESFFKLGGFPETTAFRGPLGGEDVAFMQALMSHFQPLGRIDRPCYRVWSQSGSHLDQFLAHTRINNTGFEFVRLHPDQLPEGRLAQAIAEYLANANKVDIWQKNDH